MAAEEPRELIFGEETTAEHSFDQLARELADGTLSRRRALKMMGAALVGGVLASVPGAAWAAKPAPCPPGVQKCGKNCCPDVTFICAQGKCACPTGTTRIGNTCCQNAQVCGSSCGCQQGDGCCNNVCTDLSTTTNCGACGNACATGESCVNGSCTTVCEPGWEVCGGVCQPPCPAGLERHSNSTIPCLCECPNPEETPCCDTDSMTGEPTRCVCCRDFDLSQQCCFQVDQGTGARSNAICCEAAAGFFCDPAGTGQCINL